MSNDIMMQQLHNLVPDEDWLNDQVFVVHSTYGDWVVDIGDTTTVYQVTDQLLNGPRPGVTYCNCPSCNTKKKLFGDLYPYLRGRGIHLAQIPVVDTTGSYRVARALSLTLKLLTDPKAIHRVACGRLPNWT